MSGSLNKATIIGHLGKDPEINRTQGGDVVASLSVATSERWTDKSSGERKERTEWHRVKVWGKLAEVAEKYLRKGSLVYLEGKIETRKWQDQQGQDRYSTEIVLTGFNSILTMLERAPDRADEDSRGRPSASGTGAATALRPGQTAARTESYRHDMDDEIPF